MSRSTLWPFFVRSFSYWFYGTPGLFTTLLFSLYLTPSVVFHSVPSVLLHHRLTSVRTVPPWSVCLWSLLAGTYPRRARFSDSVLGRTVQTPSRISGRTHPTSVVLPPTTLYSNLESLLGLVFVTSGSSFSVLTFWYLPFVVSLP